MPSSLPALESGQLRFFSFDVIDGDAAGVQLLPFQRLEVFRFVAKGIVIKSKIALVPSDLRAQLSRGHFQSFATSHRSPRMCAECGREDFSLLRAIDADGASIIVGLQNVNVGL